jgi:hypothetical protein
MKIIYATQGKGNTGEVMVSDNDYEFLSRHNWMIGDNGYAKTTLGANPVFMHDIVFGTKQSGKVIDHIDRNKLNNQRENLRQVSVWHNAVNREKMKGAERKYASPYVGVFHKHNAINTTYEGGMTVNGRYYSTGRFKTELEAALERDAFAYAVHGELAFLNFPDKVEEYKNWKFKGTILERYKKWG